MFQERALPDLAHNIKCGNSLIGPDFYTPLSSPLTKGGQRGVEQQLFSFDDEERLRINVFDWKAEFPQIFPSTSKGEDQGEGVGGFDAVIGNPPYVRQEALGESFKKYVQNKFESFSGTADLYVYFIEQSLRLLRQGGHFGFIVANKWMRANYGKPLRTFIVKKTNLVRIIDFGELPVFENAATFPAIVLTRNIPSQKQSFVYAPIKRLSFASLEEEVISIGSHLDERALGDNTWILSRSEEVAVFEKMKQSSVPLGKYVQDKIYYGIKIGLNEAFVIDQETKNRLIAEDPKSAELIKSFALGDDVRKYHINFGSRYLILIPKKWTREKASTARNAWNWLEQNYPSIARHLKPFEAKGEKRCDKGEYWWELRACDYYEEFEKPKIIFPDIAKSSRMTFDETGLFLGNTAYIIPVNDLYLLGILNSKLIISFYKRTSSVLGDPDKGGRLRWIYQYVIQLPIRPINFSDPTDKARHDKMVSLVEQMLDLNRKLAATKLAHEKTALERQIAATDKQTDVLVYEIYGLTEEEIKIVESS